MQETEESKKPPLEISITEELLERLVTFSQEAFSDADKIEYLKMDSQSIAHENELVRIANHMRFEAGGVSNIVKLHENNEPIVLRLSGDPKTVYFKDSPTSHSSIELDTFVELVHPSTAGSESFEVQEDIRKAFENGREVVLM